MLTVINKNRRGQVFAPAAYRVTRDDVPDFYRLLEVPETNEHRKRKQDRGAGRRSA